MCARAGRCVCVCVCVNDIKKHMRNVETSSPDYCVWHAEDLLLYLNEPTRTEYLYDELLIRLLLHTVDTRARAYTV